MNHVAKAVHKIHNIIIFKILMNTTIVLKLNGLRHGVEKRFLKLAL